MCGQWRRRGGRRKKAESYHGYYFWILKEQGAHAPGGTKSYLVNRKMTKGYAFLAWRSGVMTFTIDRDGGNVLLAFPGNLDAIRVLKSEGELS